MNKLKSFLADQTILSRPVDPTAISIAEQQLNIKFSYDYKAWLETFGVLSYQSHEVYGLGLKETAWLNILRSTPTLREENANFPMYAVPLIDAADGEIYLYDNQNNTIVLWSNLLGIVNTIHQSLEIFLIEQLSR